MTDRILDERRILESAALAELGRYRAAMAPLVSRAKSLADACPHEWSGPESYRECRWCGVWALTGENPAIR